MSSILPVRPRESVRPADEPDVWDALDRFLTHLQQTTEVNRQLRATLEVVRAATRAEVTFLFSTEKQQILDWSSSQRIAFDSLLQVTGLALAEADPSEMQLVRSCRETSCPEGIATSLAAVRLSRSKGIWLVALRGASKPPLTPRELKRMVFSRRLLQQQQSQMQAQDHLREILFSLVRCLTAALDARDPYTCGHSERVARIAVRLAEQLRLAPAVCSELYLGGLLHDIGKIGVPDQILRKTGPLSSQERHLIQEHVVIGEAIVAHVRQLGHLRVMVRHHHEQFDGKGYPDGLCGEDIPLTARILAVADSCDAMMSSRPYRDALPHSRILSIFRTQSGSQWDPAVVQALLTCQQDVFAIGQRGLGDSVAQAIEDALRSGDTLAGAMRSFFATLPAEARQGS